MFVHQTTQSGPDSQTAPPQARNTWRSSSVTLFRGQHIGSAMERLMRILVNRLILFQTTPAGVVTEPQQIAVPIGHLSWDVDLVAVEVVGLSAVSPYSLMLFRKMKPLTFVPRIPCVRTKDFV